MKKFYLLALCLFAISCQSLPKNPEVWMAFEKNSCLPTAIAFKQGLDRQGIWSEVVLYYYKDKNNKNTGHAIVAYLYPPGQNKLWTYDYQGSWRVRAWLNSPIDIAQEAEKVRGRFDSDVYSAEFLK